MIFSPFCSVVRMFGVRFPVSDHSLPAVLPRDGNGSHHQMSRFFGLKYLTLQMHSCPLWRKTVNDCIMCCWRNQRMDVLVLVSSKHSSFASWCLYLQALCEVRRLWHNTSCFSFVAVFAAFRVQCEGALSPSASCMRMNMCSAQEHGFPQQYGGHRSCWIAVPCTLIGTLQWSLICVVTGGKINQNPVVFCRSE